MRPTHLKRLALAAALLAAGSAGAADSDAAFARALDHIRAFPGRTAHSADDSFRLRDVITDADGAQHVRVERLYRGLRVVGGDMVVHSNRSGAFLDASRTLAAPLALGTTARLSRTEAVAAALAHRAGDVQGLPELIVHARGERPRLAWDVLVTGEEADETPFELHVIVDAASGAVVEQWNDIHTAPAVGSGRSLFVGTVPLNTSTATAGFSLTDSTRGNSQTVDMNNRGFGRGTLFTDADNAWGDGTTASRQSAAVDAAFGAAVTWDYYKIVHGRNGIANDGKGANSRVHYKRNYANAFWNDGCFCMTYGDGNGTSILPLVSLDVAGHEMTHGVTSRTAGLIYSGESGGVNEATSDIFGTMVEFYANNANDAPDYLIGEKIFKNGTGYIRNMMKPSIDGASADCYYPGIGNLDVHYSSGLANHFFFLLSEGTTGGVPSPTCLTSDTRVATGAATLVGIGHDKAAKIWYRALTVYMTSSMGYGDVAGATGIAATDLYGSGSPEWMAVRAAWSLLNIN